MPDMDKMNLGTLGLRAAEQFRHRKAFDTFSRGGFRGALSYGQFGLRLQQWASLLLQMGIKKGDRILLFAENGTGWPAAYFGIVLSGAIAVPVPAGFGAGTIQSIITHTGPSAVFTTGALKPALMEAGIPAGLPLVYLDTVQTAPEKNREGSVIVSINGMEKRFPLRDLPILPGAGGDGIASIIYENDGDSGARGIMLSHKNIISSALAFRSIIRVYARDRILSLAPLARQGPGFLQAILSGASTTYIDDNADPDLPFHAGRIIRPTMIFAEPDFIKDIYHRDILPSLEKHPLSRLPFARGLAYRAAGKKLLSSLGGSIRFFGLTGTIGNPGPDQFLYASRFPYSPCYGPPATAFLLAAARPFKALPGSAGQVPPGIVVRICGGDGTMYGSTENGGHIPSGVRGEIQVKGPNVGAGFYRDEEADRRKFSGDGWFRTGDSGYFDKKGRLYIDGKKE